MKIKNRITGLSLFQYSKFGNSEITAVLHLFEKMIILLK